MRAQPHHVIRAALPRRFGGVVAAAVVDDEGLDRGDPVDFLRNVAQRLRDGFFFVVRGDLNDKLHAVKVSVIMPVERLGGDAERAIASVLAQQTSFAFELIVISATPLAITSGIEVKNVVETNRNPATRRNRAASEARGAILAFIDDDAIADRDWLATASAYFDEFPKAVCIGGPDPAPPDSTLAEMISETLLATPLIGSGIVCHENRPGVFPIRRPS